MVLASDHEEVMTPSGEVRDEAERPTGPIMPSLNVAGLVVAKADLVEVLRFYVPQLVDLQSLDVERFLLTLPTPPQLRACRGL